MARPKTKSLLAEGILELVGSLRNIESKLNHVLNSKKHSGFITHRGPGRPPGTGKKTKPGRPSGKTRGPGRPPGSGNKIKNGISAGLKKRSKPGSKPTGKIKFELKSGPGKTNRRGRPVGSKNK